MTIFQFLGIFFAISIFKAMYDGFTYRSWTDKNKKLIWGYLKHLAGVLFIIITGVLFAIYGHYYDILNIKGTLLLFLAFGCLNFVWFNTLYWTFSGENIPLGRTDPIDISVLFLFNVIDKIYMSIFKTEPRFSFIPLYWFLKFASFCAGLVIIDKYIAI